MRSPFRRHKIVIVAMCLFSVAAITLSGCEYQILINDGSDRTPPEVTGSLSSSNLSSTAVRISWNEATDAVTPQASLQYKLVKASSSSSINSVAKIGAIAGSDLLMDWTQKSSSFYVTGLSEHTTYAFAVLVSDAAGNASIYSPILVTTSDATAPTVGSGITFSSIAETTLTVNWGAASDTVTASSALQYKVVRASASTSIDTISKVDLITTAPGGLVMDWTAGTVSTAVSGLTAGTGYYFAVMVKDEAGNKALYTPATTTTADLTAPTAGAGISFSNRSNTSVTVNWGAATDNVTGASSLQYKLVRASASTSIDSIDEVEAISSAGSGLVMNYTANTLTANVTGLSAGTTYYFAVVAKDGAGNRVLYSPTSVTTTNPPTVGTAISVSSMSRTGTFSATGGLSWGAASDSVTATSSLEYKVVRAYDSSEINTVTLADACASPCTVVSNWTANQTSFSMTDLGNNSLYYVAVLVRNGNGEKSLYAPVSVTTPGFSALLDSSGVYTVLSRTTSDVARVQQWNSGGSSWSTLGSTFGTSITSDTVSLIQSSSTGNFEAAVLKYYCNGWVSQTQVYQYTSSWSQLGNDLAGTEVHCGSNSGTFTPSIFDLGSGAIGAYLTQSMTGTGWTAVLRTNTESSPSASWTSSIVALGVGSQFASINRSSGHALIFGEHGTTTPGFHDVTSSGFTNLNFGVTLPASTSISEPSGAPANRIAIQGTDYYAAYIDPGNSYKASLRKYDSSGASWSQVGSAGFSSGRVSGVSVIYAQSAPYVLFKDHTKGGDATLMKWNGSAWVNVQQAIFGEEVILPLMKYDSGTSKVKVSAVLKSTGLVSTSSITP